VSAVSQQVPSDLIREVIREVISEVVATEVRDAAKSMAIGAGAGQAVEGAQVVAIRSQSDLDAAIRRILADATHPTRRAALQSGKVRFILDQPRGTGGGAAAAAPASGVHRLERGALTERHVRAAGQQGAVIHITGRVVVTPLAKERARAMGVQIVKEG